jgi:hypothetical protein
VAGSLDELLDRLALEEDILHGAVVAS